MNIITSTVNPRIKDVAKLKNARDRKQQQRIIIEGSREITLAIANDFELEALYFCPELYDQPLPDIKVELVEVTKAVFAKIAYKENPEGLLAVAKPRYRPLESLKLNPTALLLVLESVEKPGNLGAILRTAYAAKVDAVIVNHLPTDIYNPNVIRASMGHIFDVPVVVADTETTIAWLKDQNIKSYASTITATQDYSQVDYSPSVAIVMGTENSGLSDTWQQAADEQIIIPMQPGIDSLNVSVSAAIIVYEARRQRAFN